MKRSATLLLLLAIAAAALATWLFPRAFPILAVQGRIDRSAALGRADAFIGRHGLAPDSARRAIEFASDDSLRTFIELEGGGKDSLDALIASGEVDLFRWAARAFVPGDVREARVHLSPAGQVRSFRRMLPDSLRRPALDEGAARVLADSVVEAWLGEPVGRWGFLTSSYVVRQPSGRADRTFTYERGDRRVAGAPIRLDVAIAGDLVAEARRYVVIPEAFGRRYAEMRSANDLLALFATVGMLGLVVAAMVALRRYSREHSVRWRPAAFIGAVGGLLLTASFLNQLPGSWMAYDTAGSPSLHQAGGVIVALAGGAGTMLLLTLTLAAAEALTRQAFPWHLDWWRSWKYRGSREVAARVGGGYVAAAIGFAYVTLFYVVTRRIFGWWVPSALIDDPNQIATPVPWVAGIGLSLQAAVSEEALFRAVPLSLVALWARERPDRDRWMALGVVATAILFGFAHSNYPSWPPYSRGLEIFLEACAWGFLFLRFGILVPVIAHFVYDVVLFGLFATAGSGLQYRVSTIVILATLLAPALAVAWARVRQGGWIPLGDDAFFQAWRPAARAATDEAPLVAPPAAATPVLARRLALLVPVVAVVAALTTPAPRLAGPPFTATPARATTVADSMLTARSVSPDGWKRLAATGSDTVRNWRRFLKRHSAESLATVLAADYAVPSWWIVRYVRPDGTLEERAEEWRIRVTPDGRPLDIRHVIPQAAPRPVVPDDSVRRLAQAALRSAGFGAALTEAGFEEVPRPARRDLTLTYVDSAVSLPANASARAWVTIAGDEVLSVRRGVVLPEAFQREVRSADERGLATGGGLSALIFGLLLWSVVRARRRPFVVHDDPSRTAVIGAAVLLGVLSLLDAVQRLPSLLSQYDTAMPWDTFLASMATSQVMGLGGVLVMVVLWFLANGLRRRIGIPLVRQGPAASRHDELMAGLALGGTSTALSLVGRALPVVPVPAGPGTLLDQSAPFLAPVLGVIPEAVILVLSVALPILAVRGVDERPGYRAAFAVVLGVLGVGAALGLRHFIGGGLDPARDVWALVSAGATLAAIVAWGRVSATSWFVAALFAVALQALERAVVVPTGTERAGHLLAVVLCVALVALLQSWLTQPETPRLDRTRAN